EIAEIQRDYGFTTVSSVEGESFLECASCSFQITAFLRDEAEIVLIRSDSSGVSAARTDGGCFRVELRSFREIATIFAYTGENANCVTDVANISDFDCEIFSSLEVGSRAIELAISKKTCADCDE